LYVFRFYKARFCGLCLLCYWCQYMGGYFFSSMGN